jgi:hypothetical protein
MISSLVEHVFTFQNAVIVLLVVIAIAAILGFLHARRANLNQQDKQQAFNDAVIDLQDAADDHRDATKTLREVATQMQNMSGDVTAQVEEALRALQVQISSRRAALQAGTSRYAHNPQLEQMRQVAALNRPTHHQLAGQRKPAELNGRPTFSDRHPRVVAALETGAPAAKAVEPLPVHTPEGPVEEAFEPIHAYAQPGPTEPQQATVPTWFDSPTTDAGRKIPDAPQETVPTALVDDKPPVSGGAATGIQGELYGHDAAPSGSEEEAEVVAEPADHQPQTESEESAQAGVDSDITERVMLSSLVWTDEAAALSQRTQHMEPVNPEESTLQD